MLQAAGATDIDETCYLAAHPGRSVAVEHRLDTHLKSPIENLYVCDCPVIPEASGLPSSLTLVALGKRLARHLVAEQQPVELPMAARSRPSDNRPPPVGSCLATGNDRCDDPRPRNLSLWSEPQ